jgi:hypothetical protein
MKKTEKLTKFNYLIKHHENLEGADLSSNSERRWTSIEISSLADPEDKTEGWL